MMSLLSRDRPAAATRSSLTKMGWVLIPLCLCSCSAAVTEKTGRSGNVLLAEGDGGMVSEARSISVSTSAHISSSGVSRVRFMGISRPPDPVGAALLDRRDGRSALYVLRVGEVTNGIRVLDIDVRRRAVLLNVDGQKVWID